MFQRGQQESQSKSKTKDQVGDMVDSTPISAGDPVATAAAASVVYSWYQYYVKGNTEYALFTATWAPTLLSAASYMQQKDVVRKFREGLSGF